MSFPHYSLFHEVKVVCMSEKRGRRPHFQGVFSVIISTVLIKLTIPDPQKNPGGIDRVATKERATHTTPWGTNQPWGLGEQVVVFCVSATGQCQCNGRTCGRQRPFFLAMNWFARCGWGVQQAFDCTPMRHSSLHNTWHAIKSSPLVSFCFFCMDW